MVQVVVVASGTHNVDMRKPRRRRLPGSPLLQIPDDVRSVMCNRVSQEFVWAMATPKLSAFGYLKIKCIEKNQHFRI